MRTLVLGIGNPLLGDDGVGLEVARRVRARLASRPDVVVEEACAGGLAVAERLVGYDRAVLVDATEPAREPGTVRVLEPGTEPGSKPGTGRGSKPGTRATWNTRGAHDASLDICLKFLADLGEAMPRKVEIVAVEARELTTFGEQLSPEVELAVPKAVARVVELVGEPGGAR